MMLRVLFVVEEVTTPTQSSGLQRGKKNEGEMAAVTATTTGAIGAAADPDRLEALKEFDATKTGVKGLVDSGVATVPAIFRLPHPRPPSLPISNLHSIPVVDLSLPRPLAVDLVAAASRRWGFFQVINHGDESSAAILRAISAVRSFHDLPAEARSRHYTRDISGGFTYASNLDLYRSRSASWRDSMQISFGGTENPPNPDSIPEVCREAAMAWDGHAAAIGRTLMGLLSEGLGGSEGMLEARSCLEGRIMVAHYYPPCPEPEATMGIAGHSDPSALTLLVQDGVGGLQVKVEGGDDGEEVWVEVEPIPGAIVVNVGDLLQIMSNDMYKSAEHRVVANAKDEARVSIAIFFNPSRRGESDLYGPLPELMSTPARPALFRSFAFPEFLSVFFSGELRPRYMVDHFRITDQ